MARAPSNLKLGHLFLRVEELADDLRSLPRKCFVIDRACVVLFSHCEHRVDLKAGQPKVRGADEVLELVGGQLARPFAVNGLKELQKKLLELGEGPL